MAPQPPPFSSQEYWENRFQRNPSAFDWLVPSGTSILEKHIVHAVSTCAQPAPQILHIGSGTSLLSFHLKSFVQDSRQIHNIDFSKQAVEWGRKTEEQLYPDGAQKYDLKEHRGSAERQPFGDVVVNGPARQRMEWSQVDLVSLTSVISSLSHLSYTVIIDKSTSDAIACGEDVAVPLPFVEYYPAGEVFPRPMRESHTVKHLVHPVIVLALHLALVTPPGARWISLSYSAARFPCISDPDHDVDLLDMRARGLPLPSKFWTMVCKEPIEVMDERSHKSDQVHRPAVFNWLYVLERTENILKVSDCQ
ncbi:hypothetical protein EJ08DRAFT_83657 [Tothia fuscella]|uniref:Uncharacterized protein n=1 Tax=Tothia fuscella TaxID=1048955 RepID=A0A9P4NEP9_9PEZI|nr:hypothetical protein EJ08DRAFT_83657 [Tothia fuscella]